MSYKIPIYGLNQERFKKKEKEILPIKEISVELGDLVLMTYETFIDEENSNKPILGSFLETQKQGEEVIYVCLFPCVQLATPYSPADEIIIPNLTPLTSDNNIDSTGAISAISSFNSIFIDQMFVGSPKEISDLLIENFGVTMKAHAEWISKLERPYLIRKSIIENRFTN